MVILCIGPNPEADLRLPIDPMLYVDSRSGVYEAAYAHAPHVTLLAPQVKSGDRPKVQCMCYMYYLIAERPLPVFLHSDRYRELQVVETDEATKACIRRRCVAPYIYSLFSWQGCGCGFFYEPYDAMEAALSMIPDADMRSSMRSVWQQGYDSVASLAQYMQDMRVGGSIALYIVAAGQEGMPLEHTLPITAHSFRGNQFQRPLVNTMLQMTSHADSFEP